MPEIQIPKCPRCGTTLVKVKDKEYYGCPNWLPGNKGCEGTIWWPDGYRKNNYPLKAFSYRVESKSNPGHFHTVTIYQSGDMDCPCAASQMQKFCRHKLIVINEVKKLIEKIKKENNLCISNQPTQKS